MHPRITELLDYLDAKRHLLRAAVDRVPEDRRARRPAPDHWSVAEVLEHLSLVEGAVGKVIATQLAEARANGLGAETATTPVLETIDLGRVLDRRQHITTSGQMEPRQGLAVAAAWVALERTRTVLRDAIIAADGLALGEVVLPHPVFGALNIYEWIAVTGAHEARHTAQVDEIATALAGRTTAAADRAPIAPTVQA